MSDGDRALECLKIAATMKPQAGPVEAVAAARCFLEFIREVETAGTKSPTVPSRGRGAKEGTPAPSDQI